MTLRQLFDLLANNPSILIFFFVACPLTALLSAWLGRGEGHLTPWKYLYSVLVYLICVPGIFSITLNIYLFLFERQSIFDTDIWTQVLPIVSMVATLLLIRNNVSFSQVPGFGKLHGLMIIITVVLVLMFLLDRTHIFVITIVPFYQAFIFFLILLAIAVWGWSKMKKPDVATGSEA